MAADPDTIEPSVSTHPLWKRFPALQHRDFRLLWYGQIISLAGSQMQAVAINWQIYQRTNSPVLLGFVGLSRVIPIIIFSLIGGVVADSYRRKGIMFITQTVMMLSAITLAVATHAGFDSAALILAMTAVSAAASSFDNPARQALIPNLVPAEHLTNAVSLNTMMFQTSMILGPALSGFVIGWGGPQLVYWINAATFVAVIGALVLMKVAEKPGGGRSQINLGTFTEGLKFVRQSKIIFSTMILDFFATFFSSATALLPIFARDVLKVGPTGLGVLYSGEAIGSLVAGVGMSISGDPKHKGRLLLAGVAFYGLATTFYGFSTSFLLSFILLMLVGAGDSVSTVLRQTIRQTTTPDNMRGRMTSVNMIFFMGGPQLGNLEAGLLAGMIGAPLSVVTGGIATVVLVGFTAWMYPQLRRYGR